MQLINKVHGEAVEEMLKGAGPGAGDEVELQEPFLKRMFQLFRRKHCSTESGSHA